MISPQLIAADGSRWRAAAFAWVPGRHLNHGINTREMRRAGALLARMHRANRDVPTGISAARPVWWIPRLFELATEMRDLVQATVAPPAHLSPTIVHDIRTVHDALVTAHASLRDGTQSEGLIHTDTHWQNLRVTPQRIGLVDFEDFANGRFMLDVACLWDDLEQRADARQLLDAALDGYSGVMPLPPDYARDLSTMMAFRRFDLAGWVLSWPRIDQRAWGPGLLRGLRAYAERCLAR